MAGAPGFGFKRLLEQADDNTLRQLISPHVCDLLTALDPAILNGARLRQFVRDSRSSRAYLSDPSARVVLLEGLPPDKARELCRALELADDADPYSTLKLAIIRPGSAAEDTLLSFFGAIADPTARRAIVPVDFASAQYALFPYQRKAAREVRARLNRPPRRLVLHMPTGAGKTRTTMNVIAEHLREHEPTVVIWLAYSRELLDQAASEFADSWSRLGDRDVTMYRFWGNATCDPLHLRDGLIVASLGKLYAWSKRDLNALPTLADRVSLTVMDEAHHSIAKTYADILDLFATKRQDGRLLGLTATPGRTWADIEEDARLAEFFGRQKVTLDIEGYANPVTYLIDKGYLARPTFRTLNIESGLALSAEDLRHLRSELEVPKSVLERLADEQTRNLKVIAETESLLSRHDRVIVFATTVGHAELMSAVLRARGHNATSVTGNTPDHERQGIIQRYMANTHIPMVVCNYGVLTTGFDAPRTSAALIARPTRSLVLFSQMVGRAIRGRLAGGNDTAEIVTVIDPELPGFGDVSQAFENWEDVWQQRL
jgi:DNA repair protein RadD